MAPQGIAMSQLMGEVGSFSDARPEDMGAPADGLALAQTATILVIPPPPPYQTSPQHEWKKNRQKIVPPRYQRLYTLGDIHNAGHVKGVSPRQEIVNGAS